MASVRETATSYARGAAGGLLLAMPVLYTMEMWWAGFNVPAWRLLLFVVASYGVLLILQHFSGLGQSETPFEEARDALVAYGIGLAEAALVLLAIGVLRGDQPLRDLVGKVVIQATPIAIGASVAMSEFGEKNPRADRRKQQESFWGVLGMAYAGAMLFGLGVAATEEPMMVGIQLHWPHALGILLLSLIQVHGIVYHVEFRRRERGPGGRRWWQYLVREGVSAYVAALVISAYLLWTFGYLGTDTGMRPTTYMVLSLGFVTSLGAAAGELLI